MKHFSVPLRIDIGGGVSDIPTFAQDLGTYVVNFGVTIYSDAQYKNPFTLEGEYNDVIKGPSILQYNEQELRWDEIKNSDQPFYYLKSFISHLNGTHKPFHLRIVNTLPISTGLGGSGALSILLTALFAQESSILNANLIIKKAHHIEVNQLGITGGFQDFIGAYFGGINEIDFNSLEQVDLMHNPNLGIPFDTQMKEYLDSHMILIMLKNEHVSSEKIVEDEIINYLSNKNEYTAIINGIKESNKSIYSALMDRSSKIESRITTIGMEMNKSSQLQKKLSSYLQKGLLNNIENEIESLSYGTRRPGAGGNSLFVLLKENSISDLQIVLQKYHDKVYVFYLKVNEKGLRAKHKREKKTIA